MGGASRHDLFFVFVCVCEEGGFVSVKRGDCLILCIVNIPLKRPLRRRRRRVKALIEPKNALAKNRRVDPSQSMV